MRAPLDAWSHISINSAVPGPLSTKMKAAASVPPANDQDEWSVADARELYMIDKWGGGYFDVNDDGNVTVSPLQTRGGKVVLLDVVKAAMAEEGLKTPMIIRFQDMLHHRVRVLNEAFNRAITEKGIEPIADTVLERWFTEGFRVPSNPDYRGYRNMLIRQPVAGYTGTCAALRDTDFTEASARLDLPVICIVGDQDGSTPPDLVLSTAKLIPNARYEVIANAGHIPCVEQPEALVAIIKAFIKEFDLGRKAEV